MKLIKSFIVVGFIILATTGVVRAEITSSITPPAGVNGNVQFNKKNGFGSDTTFTYSSATKNLSVSTLTVTNLVISSVSFSSATIINATIGTITVSTVIASTVTASYLSVSSAAIVTLTVSSITATRLVVSSVTVSSITAITIIVSSITTSTITANLLIASSGTIANLNTSTFTVINSLGIGTNGVAGKPDASLSIVNTGLPGQPSRQGIDIDATNNSVSKLPFLIFTNKSTPTFGIGGCIAFIQQLPTADVQQGILAFSQDTTTNTANFQLYLRAGGAHASDSVPVFSVFGKPSGVGVSSNTIGYGYAMFGPTGADSVGTPFGSYTPSAILHVSSDFGDGSDGIRIERRSTPNAARYGIRVDSNGSLIIDTVGSSVDDPIIAILPTGQINVQGAISSTRQIIAKGTTIAEDLGEGYVSQYVSSMTTVFQNMATSGQYGNVASIAVSSGDWAFEGVVVSTINGATINFWNIAISTYSGNTTTDHILGWNELVARPAVSGASENLITPVYRVLSASNLTVYLKARATYSVATPQVLGSLRGRRVH